MDHPEEPKQTLQRTPGKIIKNLREFETKVKACISLQHLNAFKLMCPF